MLVLTRRVGETVVIGDDVAVTIFVLKRNQVRIGIDAPENVPVYREEVFRRIQQEQQAELRGETELSAGYVSA